MHGRHIAIFAGVSRAHIHPFLGLCPELVRRGYRVTIVTNESLAKLVTEAGGEPVVFEPCRLELPLLANNALPANDAKCWEEIGEIVFPWTLNTAALAVCQLDGFYKRNRPDLIIYEFSAYAGRILAKRLHLPAIQYYHDFIYLSGSYCWTDGVGYNPSSMVEYYKLLDSFMWAYGFEQPNNFWYREELNLCPLPREFQFDSDFIDGDHFYFVGPLLDRPFTRIWKNRSGGKRIILVSTLTGSIDANYFNKVIDGLSNSEYHVILSVGRNFETGGLRPLPPNFEINTCASHLEILPYTDLHLYSGGISGTLEGFYFGVVLIAMPTFSYNYRIAERLAERGLTLNLPFHALTSQMIRDSVDAALRDHALLGRVRQMQTVVRSSGGAREAVDRIEKFLAEHT